MSNSTINLRIIEINPGSLISIKKRQEFNTFLSQHHPDIVLISETNLSTFHKLSFLSYTFIRSDKQQGKRGTGILIKNSLAYEQINTAEWKLLSLESTACLIRSNNKSFLIVAVYRFTNRLPLDVSDLDTVVNAALAWNNCSLIMGGDFNARHELWFNNSRCASGTNLNEWLTHNGRVSGVKIAHTLQPTFYRGTYSSFLDFFLIDETLIIPSNTTTHNCLNILDYPSDHRAVELFISIDNELHRAPPIKIPIYSKTNWRTFNEAIEEGLVDVKVENLKNMTTVEIDTAIVKLTDVINNTMDTHIPKIEIRPDNNTPLPPQLIALIKEKNRLRRQWQRSRYSHYAHLLKSQIACLTKIVDEQVIIARKQHLEKELSKVKLDNNTFQNIRKHSGYKQRHNIPPLLNTVTNITETLDQPKATLLAEHFARVHKQNDNTGNLAFTNQVNADIHAEYRGTFNANAQFSRNDPANPLQFNRNIHLVSDDSLCAILKTRANKRSRGPDNIPNIVLKKLSKKCISLIATLFNQCFNIGYFPTSWRKAATIAIPKKDNASDDPKNYRPIALLSCLSKTFEVAIKERIMEHCEDHNILPDDQFGYRPRRSTTQALVKLHTDIALKLSNAVPTIACTLDIEKAFDTTWTEGIIYKMQNIHHFPRHLCKLIYEFLSKRSFYVILGKAESPEHHTTAGVPQGGVLSAVLYSIFIADMPSPPQHQNPIKRLQYADDTLLYVSTENLVLAEQRMNGYIKELVEFYNKWRIKLNPSKAETIVFRTRNCNRRTLLEAKNIRLKINDNPIPLQLSIKYLGIIFNSRFSFIPQVSETIRKTHNAFGVLRSVLRRTSGLSTKIKLLCYKQLVRPIISYGFLTWCHISSSQMERLRKVERKLLRACVNYQRPRNDYRLISNTALYNLANIQRIDSFLLTNAIKTLNNWPEHEILQQCIIEDVQHLSGRFKPAWYIKHLNDNHLLFDGPVPIYYHRAYNINRDDLVYNIGV